MPLLTSVLRKMGVSQPFQRFIDELLLLLLMGVTCLPLPLKDQWVSKAKNQELR